MSHIEKTNSFETIYDYKTTKDYEKESDNSSYSKSKINFVYSEETSEGYIYFLQEREFIKTNENIYKIGMTNKKHLERFNQYPKGSKLLFQITCNNANKVEKEIINSLKNKFIRRKDIGNEYFEGNYLEMIDLIFDCTRNSFFEKKNIKSGNNNSSVNNCNNNSSKNNKLEYNKPDINKPDINKPDINKPEINKANTTKFFHFRCVRCLRDFNNKSNLIKHLHIKKKCLAKNPLSILLSDKQVLYESTIKLDENCNKICKNTKYICVNCSKNFSSKRSLDAHKKNIICVSSDINEITSILKKE